MHAYPEDIASARSLVLTNAACPGETSASFLDAAGRDNGCKEHKDGYRTHAMPATDGLHVEYAGTQLAFALDFLQRTPNTQLITVDIGANDLLLLQHDCGSGTAAVSCIASKLTDTVNVIGTNFGTILSGLRNAGYGGAIVVQSYYQTDYNDAIQGIGIGNLNAKLASVAAMYNATVADVDAAFKKAAAAAGNDTCAAGLLIKMPDGTCNLHPNEMGRALISSTVTAIVP